MGLLIRLKTVSFLAFLCIYCIGRSSAQTYNQDQINGEERSQGSWHFVYQTPEYPRDCREVLDQCSSVTPSGVYLIKPDGYSEPFEVYCNNDVDGGGWTVIQRRLDGSLDFRRNWEAYRKGFGFLASEFWVGNERLSFLTNQNNYELQIHATLSNGSSFYVNYSSFSISDEWGDFTLATLGNYTGDADFVRTPFTDCNDVRDAGNTQDGVYTILPSGWLGSPFEVFCNMTIDGGSWTVFQRRNRGATGFYNNWTTYKNGFGDIEDEFWLGNDKLHNLTQHGVYELRVDFVTPSDSAIYAKYTSFRIDSETNRYRVTDIGTYSGDGLNGMADVANKEFSTHDEDNDGLSYDCAERHRGGWWYGGSYAYRGGSACDLWRDGSFNRRCALSNPNGDYNGGLGQNIFWYVSRNGCYAKYTEMKIRRTS